MLRKKCSTGRGPSTGAWEIENMKLFKSVDLHLESVGPVFIVGCLLAIMVFAPGNAATTGVTKMKKDNAKYDTPSKEKPDTAKTRDTKSGGSMSKEKPDTAKTRDTKGGLTGSKEKPDTANKRDAKGGLSQPNAKPATATWDTPNKKADTANMKLGTGLSKSAPYQSPLLQSQQQKQLQPNTQMMQQPGLLNSARSR
jgi:hypothetical protein